MPRISAPRAVVALTAMLASSCGAADAATTTEPAALASSSASPPREREAVGVAAHDGEPTRMQVSLTSCMAVGYGEACACEVWSRRTVPEKARLEVCVGSSGLPGLYERVGAASSAGKPVELWVDVVPAPESARYCGVLILDSGEHLRVVDYER